MFDIIGKSASFSQFFNKRNERYCAIWVSLSYLIFVDFRLLNDQFRMVEEDKSKPDNFLSMTRAELQPSFHLVDVKFSRQSLIYEYLEKGRKICLRLL